MTDDLIIPEVLEGKNLTKTIKTVKKRELAKYLSKDFIRDKLQQITNPKDKFFIIFLWMTGVRISEAITITKGDIDIKDKVMRIRWLKNRKFQERNIPIHPLLNGMLEMFIAPLNLEDKIFPFTRVQGFHITKRWLGVSPHKLRHSFAVNWLREGGDLAQLKGMLGHKYLNTTGEYLKIVPSDIGKELEKIKF